MAKYRKTALTEAYMFGDPDMPQEFINALCFESQSMCNPFVGKPHIHTLEGAHGIRVTDWIAKGIKCEFWPIKDDIFQATYELADTADALSGVSETHRTTEPVDGPVKE